MKFIIMFVAAFALTAGVVAFARVSLGEAPEAEVVETKLPVVRVESKPGEHSEHKHSEHAETEVLEEKAKNDDVEEKHAHGDFWACPMFCTRVDGPGVCPVCGMDLEKFDEIDQWADDVRVDLENKLDPVNGEAVTDENRLSLTFQGLKVHLNSEKSVRKFKRRPIEFLVPLKLEMLFDRTVKQVDPSDFIDPPIIPPTCPMMGSEINPEKGVFMFHRGYKIYFCCWNGCADDFLAAPEYAAYGLKESDGKLVPTE